MPKLIVPPVILLNRIDYKGFIVRNKSKIDRFDIEYENIMFFHLMLDNHPYSFFEDTFDYEAYFYITSVDEYRFIKMQMEAA